MPSPHTLISSEPDDDNEDEKATKILEATEILTRARDVIDQIDSFENITLEQILQASNVPLKTYMDALHTSKRGNTLVLKRKPHEMKINNYNPDILRAWRANMDIQYVLDAYACVMYITSYMMKSERAMGELLKHVSKECRGDDIRSQLRKLGSTFLNHRELSMQESAYRILSLPLKKLSRKCVFIYTDPKNERLAMTKPLANIRELENDDEDLYLTNLTDRYVARPNHLENLCLAEFAANYQVKYSCMTENENDHTPDPLENEEGNDKTNIIRLKMVWVQCKNVNAKQLFGFHIIIGKNKVKNIIEAKLCSLFLGEMRIMILLEIETTFMIVTENAWKKLLQRRITLF